MKVKNTNFPLIAAALLTLGLLLPGQSLAFSVFVTSGDYCNIQNFGGDPAKVASRKQNGGYYNISRGFNYKISCPLMIDATAESFDVLIRYSNNNTFSQNYECRLDEYATNDERVRSITRSKVFRPFWSDALLWEDLRLSGPANRLYAVCNMPPLSALGLVMTFNYD